MHEFTHIAAHINAFSTNKEEYIASLEREFESKIDEIYKLDVNKFYHLLEDQKTTEVDPNNILMQSLTYSQHTDFYLGLEKINISYTDLYLNLLFSKEDFEEFFNDDKKKEFFELLKNENSKNSKSSKSSKESKKPLKAMDMYRQLVKNAAKAEWVPEKFAINKADVWLDNYVKNFFK